MRFGVLVRDPKVDFVLILTYFYEPGSEHVFFVVDPEFGSWFETPKLILY